MVWYETFDAAFWITLTTIVTGTVTLGVRYCLKSKCEHCSLCCGAVIINRRVDVELEEHKTDLDFEVNGSPVLNKSAVFQNIYQSQAKHQEVFTKHKYIFTLNL